MYKVRVHAYAALLCDALRGAALHSVAQLELITTVLRCALQTDASI